jgi:hypothetical protein
VALFDEDTSMMDALGESLLVDLGLETSLQEFLGGELKDEIKFELIIGQEPVTAHATEKGGSLEDALGILGVQGQEGAGSLSQLCEGKLNTPDLALASESVLSDKLELGIETFLLERTTGRLERLAV